MLAETEALLGPSCWDQRPILIVSARATAGTSPSSAMRTASRSDCGVGCFELVVEADVEVDVVVELAWFDPLEQPASATLETTRANVSARFIAVPRNQRPRVRQRKRV